MNFTPAEFVLGQPHIALAEFVGNKNRAEIARRADMTAPHLTMILSGARRCTEPVARRLARALHCPYSALVHAAPRKVKR